MNTPGDDEIFDALFESRASASDLARLKELLRDPAARARFAERAVFEGQLTHACRALAVERTESSARMWRRGMVIAAAAACVLVAAIVGYRFTYPRQTPIVTASPEIPSVTMDSPTLETRDSALWPFASNSPWNMPLGSGAEYASITAPDFPRDWAIHLKCEKSQPIFIASAADPLTEIKLRQNGQTVAALRVPPNAVAGKDPYESLSLIDEQHRNVYELLMVRRMPDGSLSATRAYQNELVDAGLGPEGTRRGTRLFGGPALGGVLRAGELRAGVRHVLALTVTRRMLNAAGSNGQAFVWPARTGGANAAELFGHAGNVQVGSLLALNADFDANAHLKDAPPELRRLAEALRDYGGYVVEPSFEEQAQLEIIAEPSARGDLGDGYAEFLKRLLPELRVITNNSPATPGGGGTPRKPLAPLLPSVGPQF